MAHSAPPPSLAIYFAAPVTTPGGHPRAHYAAQVAYLKRFGRVLTEHLASPEATAAHDAAASSPAAVFAQDQVWLAEADVVVADITFPSTGTGMTLGMAAAAGKKILAMWDSSRIAKASTFVSGCPNALVLPYASTREWQEAVRFFIPPARIFLFGAPGSGKGTLAADLAAHLGLVHLSTGDVLRAYRAEKAGSDDALAAELAGYMDAGKLVPAGLMASIVTAKLASPTVRRRGCIIDGYPPSMEDADAMRAAGVFPTSLLVLDCPPEVAAARQVSRAARATDTPEKAASRVATYIEKTAPVLASYPEEMVVHVDATQSIEGVRASALAGLLRQFREGYAAWARSSYVLHAGPVTSARFHSHVDAVNHAYLRAACKRMVQTGSSVKIYPVSDLELGPQSSTPDNAGAAVYVGGSGSGAGAAGSGAGSGSGAAASPSPFAPVYSRLVNFHRISGNPVDEAFVTVQMGDDSLDYAQLSSALEVAASYGHGEVLVETEENIFEASVRQADGALQVSLDAGETPFAVDFSRLPTWAEARALPKKLTPRFELHHGFDIAKSHPDEPAPPIDPKEVVAAASERGFCNGGWFIFAKKDVWAYRTNEFSNAEPAACVAELSRQAAALHGWLAERLAHAGPDGRPRPVAEQGVSLEKVLAMWPFRPEA